MQSTDERKCRYIFNTVGNFGLLALEVADVGLEIVTLSHFDGKEVGLFFLACRREAN